MRERQLRDMLSYGRTSAGFENPFVDYSQFFVPDRWRDLLYFCQQLYLTFGPYRSSLKKLYGYFLTDLQISGEELTADVAKKQETYMRDDMQVIAQLYSLLEDVACYGIAFRLYYPYFQRFVASPWNVFDIDDVFYDKRFQLKVTGDLRLVGYDPIAKQKCPFKIFNAPGGKQTPPMVLKLNPFDMEAYCDSDFTRDTRYRWIIPQTYVQKLKQGDPITWRWVDESILDDIRRGSRRVEFNKNSLFAFTAPTVSGAAIQGWGFPPMLYHFRSIAHAQSYRRANEAITQDRLLPIRVIMPGPQSNHSGPVSGTGGLPSQMDGGKIIGHIDRIINQHRRSPDAYYSAPFNVEMAMLGADGTAMAAAQLLDSSERSLINEIGLPLDLYSGTMQLQSTPIAARLMEAVFQDVPQCCNLYLGWLHQNLVRSHSFQPGRALLLPSRIADDVQKLAMEFQLMLAGHMSATSVLESLRRQPDFERQLIRQETTEAAKEQMEMQEELERQGLGAQIRQGVPMTPSGQPLGGDPAAMGAAQGGMPAAGPGGGGGDPAAGGMFGPGSGLASSKVDEAIQRYQGNSSLSIDQVEPIAQEIAQYLFTLGESQKDSELRKLHEALPTIHASAQKALQKLRDDNARNAVAAQQQAGLPPQM